MGEKIERPIILCRDIKSAIIVLLAVILLLLGIYYLKDHQATKLSWKLNQTEQIINNTLAPLWRPNHPTREALTRLGYKLAPYDEKLMKRLQQQAQPQQSKK